MAKPPYWGQKSHLLMKNAIYTIFGIFDEQIENTFVQKEIQKLNGAKTFKWSARAKRHVPN